MPRDLIPGQKRLQAQGRVCHAMTGPLDLCRQSFSKPVSSKPIFCGLNVILPKLATTLMPRDGDVGATTFKDGCQFASLTCRNQRIQGRRADEYKKIAK